MKKPAPARPQPKEKIEGPFAGEDALPPRVAAMREKILEACESGDIEKLRPAIERNETLPLFGKAGDRPRSFAVTLDFLKARSFDGNGGETLAILEAVLKSPYAKVARGPHVQFVWPAFAVMDLPAADVETALGRLRCAAFADALAAGFASPPVHRVEIGEDGTWHAFGVS